jgi:hypothetical protein
VSAGIYRFVSKYNDTVESTAYELDLLKSFGGKREDMLYFEKEDCDEDNCEEEDDEDCEIGKHHVVVRD